MGIPVYFKTLVSQYNDQILHKQSLPGVHTLCFDLNCLIHPCCRGFTDESDMIQKILETMKILIDYVNPNAHVYIAIDGIPPCAKMKQQRQRRYRSTLEKKVWDTNAISPGTYFMHRLNQALDTWLLDQSSQYPKRQYHLSDSCVPGEGEHKLLDFLRSQPVHDQPIVIYGLDADLIQLGLVSDINQIYLLRETTEYNIEDTDSDYVYLNIDALKYWILEDLGVSSKISDRQVIHDYIFLCMLMGNDFVNHIPSLNLRYGGLERVLDVYKKLHRQYQGYYALIDTQLDDLIHLPFFRELITELAKTEKHALQKIQNQRYRQYKRLSGIYGSEYHEFLKRFPSDQSQPLQLQHVYDFLNSVKDNDERFSEMVLHLPTLRFKNEPHQGSQDTPELCEDFMDSLVWTTHYYFKGCHNWSWKTRYSHGPSCQSLSEYLSHVPSVNLDSDLTPSKITDMFEYIFPPESQCLHGYDVQSILPAGELQVDTTGCRYLWEAPLVNDL